MAKRTSNVAGVSGDRLKQFIERIERLVEEKENILDDIRDVKAEAKSVGFDMRTINELLKLRRLSPQQREERDALLDIYKAAIGMLDGTPLGEAAIKRLSKKDPPEPDGEDEPENGPLEPEATEQKFMPNVDLEKARELGRTASAAGVPVVQNPFPARDPRRAAWDEAWCQESGHDGMDIPEAWRASKPKKPEPEPEAE